MGMNAVIQALSDPALQTMLEKQANATGYAEDALPQNQVQNGNLGFDLSSLINGMTFGGAGTQAPPITADQLGAGVPKTNPQDLYRQAYDLMNSVPANPAAPQFQNPKFDIKNDWLPLALTLLAGRQGGSVAQGFMQGRAQQTQIANENAMRDYQAKVAELERTRQISKEQANILMHQASNQQAQDTQERLAKQAADANERMLQMQQSKLDADREKARLLDEGRNNRAQAHDFVRLMGNRFATPQMMSAYLSTRKDMSDEAKKFALDEFTAGVAQRTQLGVLLNNIKKGSPSERQAAMEEMNRLGLAGSEGFSEELTKAAGDLTPAETANLARAGLLQTKMDLAKATFDSTVEKARLDAEAKAQGIKLNDAKTQTLLKKLEWIDPLNRASIAKSEMAIESMKSRRDAMGTPQLKNITQVMKLDQDSIKESLGLERKYNADAINKMMSLQHSYGDKPVEQWSQADQQIYGDLKSQISQRQTNIEALTEAQKQVMDQQKNVLMNMPKNAPGYVSPNVDAIKQKQALKMLQSASEIGNALGVQDPLGKPQNSTSETAPISPLQGGQLPPPGNQVPIQGAIGNGPGGKSTTGATVPEKQPPSPLKPGQSKSVGNGVTIKRTK